MQKIINASLNGIFFTAIVLIAVTVATIALTKRVNENNAQYSNNITGTVVKQTIPVLTFTKGIVQEINVKTGQEVKKGDILVRLDNPVIRSKKTILEKYTDNVSAQAEAKVADEELKNLIIVSPVNGMIGDIEVAEASTVDDFSKLLTIHSNENIRFLVKLTAEQYQMVKNSKEIKAYSKRLNQNFSITIEMLEPDQKATLNFEEKKIGVFFRLTDQYAASALLNNEDLEINFDNNKEKVKKPIDYFVEFWNSLLSRPVEK